MTELVRTAPTLAALYAMRDEIIALANQHGASNVRVFGSVARGEASPNSDIDFLVDWDYQRLTAWGSAGLWTDLETLLGHPVDIGSAAKLHWSIRDRVLREAILL